MEIPTQAFFNYLLEASVCLAVFYGVYMLALRNQANFIYNRVYLLGSSLLALVIPLLEIPFLESASAQFSPMSQSFSVIMVPEIAIHETTETVPAFSWQQALVWAYFAGVSVFLIRFLWQSAGIINVIRRGDSQCTQKGYKLVLNDQLPISSFFHYLLWNQQPGLGEPEKHSITAHEEVHIFQGHSYDVMYMSVLKILLWFNPFAYFWCKELTDVHEYTADAKAVEATNTKAYAKILVNQLFHGVGYSLLNHFYKSQTLKRLKMMELKKNKTNKYRILWTLPVFALMLFVFSCQEEEDEMSKLNAKSQEYANATDAERTYLPDANGVFTVVEEQPVPEGGMKTFYEYVVMNMKYPAEARRQGITGRVFVQFVVDTDGSITEVETLKGIGKACDEEAERIVKNALAWNPGRQDGKAVKVKMVLPITFKLDGKETAAASEDHVPDEKMSEVVVVGYSEK